MSDFIPIEHMFTTWPTARADIEPMVPDRPVFIPSPTDRKLIELDQTWAMQMLALAPDEDSFNILMGRIEWLGTVNASALQACRMDQYHGLPVNEQTLYKINENVQRQDDFRQMVRLPSFRELALDALGLKPITHSTEFQIQVKPHDTLQ